ncbi:hypothetical protein K469DRAFT_640128 [Zopfia rhizophila CBS 207.26]|uniref:Zn(2)-C6 fungal-type domain-containing protein n=1 Tax=Zopfia rhizophila CBS 207.26 TaxID=1314779 RepID=A0A6A6DMG9_9PEZI|nr:hypothetical protein K469DRAFT_640128 [Zopfia rhizophila CBS 207.26]
MISHLMALPQVLTALGADHAYDQEVKPYPDVVSMPQNFENERPKKWKRASRACDRCRDRKSKCDQQLPCSHCLYYSLDCNYGQSTRMRTQKSQNTRATSRITSKRERRTPRQIHQRPSETSSLPDAGIDSDYRAHPRAHDFSIFDSTCGDSCDAPEAAPTSSVDEEETTELDFQEVIDTGPTELDGVNNHTHGKEFYGGSSNLAFLANLFWKMHKSGAITGLHHPKANRSSLIDLMYSTDFGSPVVHETTRTKVNVSSLDVLTRSPRTGKDGSISPENSTNTEALDSFGSDCLSRHVSSALPQAETMESGCNPIEVERTLTQAYFNNVHYIHPMLQEKEFEERCLKTVWSTKPSERLRDHHSQFMALYYAVVALGAINSGPDEAWILKRNSKPLPVVGASRRQGTALDWASHYFDLAKHAMGDMMEVSTLESCQALFMMTVFCQNALKPHACYMYSGHAVRTAIAIGLANQSWDTYAAEGQRTWWCIYSHEIEMCCSSGRLDSLLSLDHYSSPLPEKTEEVGETSEVAIIRVMVDLACILKRASMSIYCNPGRCSTSQLSEIAMKLDGELIRWKASLPSVLDFSTDSLDDPVWAHKQKGVLRSRYHNARILIHRPFIIGSVPAAEASELTYHIEMCLDAARKTIQISHSALGNKIYLRTWWYGTTYTMYATSILLYLLLKGTVSTHRDELIADIEKSLEIFNAMKQIVVARKCAEITQEMLTEAKKQRHHVLQNQEECQSMITGVTDMAHVLDIVSTDRWNDNSFMTILNQTLQDSENIGISDYHGNPFVLEGFSFPGLGQSTEGVDIMMGLDGNTIYPIDWLDAGSF